MDLWPPQGGHPVEGLSWPLGALKAGPSAEPQTAHASPEGLLEKHSFCCWFPRQPRPRERRGATLGKGLHAPNQSRQREVLQSGGLRRFSRWIFLKRVLQLFSKKIRVLQHRSETSQCTVYNRKEDRQAGEESAVQALSKKNRDLPTRGPAGTRPRLLPGPRTRCIPESEPSRGGPSLPVPLGPLLGQDELLLSASNTPCGQARPCPQRTDAPQPAPAPPSRAVLPVPPGELAAVTAPLTGMGLRLHGSSACGHQAPIHPSTSCDY